MTGEQKAMPGTDKGRERLLCEIESRFRSRVVSRPNGCLEWVGTRLSSGYGVMSADGKSLRAHRIAWTLVNGPIPAGLDVLHKCDNPPCVNPDHLFLGTDKDNHQDKARKGRHWQQKKTHCPKGHPYDEANTYRPPSGGRKCRTCLSLSKVSQ